MFKINNKDTTTTPTWKVSYDEVTYRRYHLPWSVSTIVVGQFLKGCDFTSRHFFVQSQYVKVYWRICGVFIFNFEQISDIVLVFSLSGSPSAFILLQLLRWSMLQCRTSRGHGSSKFRKLTKKIRICQNNWYFVTPCWAGFT